MAKVTSKLQVTIPRRLARERGIEPGDEIEWAATADGLRITPATDATPGKVDVETRLRLLKQSFARQKARQRRKGQTIQSEDRGWTREELYDRDRSR